MTKKEIQLLYAYDAWADSKMLESVAALSPEQFAKDFKSSFNGIQGTLVHILSANFVWLNRWNGKAPSPLKAENFSTVEVLKKQWDAYQKELENFLRVISDEALDTPFQYTDFKGNTYSQKLYLQMQHKVNHSTYHRGQIVTMLRQLDVKPIGTDFINYVRSLEKSG